MKKNIKKKAPEKGFIKGEITALIHRQDDPLLKIVNKGLSFLAKVGFISRKTLEKYYFKGRRVQKIVDENIICTAGFNAVAQVLTGEYADTGEITHMALGDGVGTPAVGDTALFNEVYRNVKASETSSGAVAIITAFFEETEIDGTFTEFGNFIDGTGTVDTGLIWSHLNVAWTKTDEETLTVQCKYTLSNKP